MPQPSQRHATRAFTGRPPAGALAAASKANLRLVFVRTAGGAVAVAGIAWDTNEAMELWEEDPLMAYSAAASAGLGTALLTVSAIKIVSKEVVKGAAKGAAAGALEGIEVGPWAVATGAAGVVAGVTTTVFKIRLARGYVSARNGTCALLVAQRQALFQRAVQEQMIYRMLMHVPGM